MFRRHGCSSHVRQCLKLEVNMNPTQADRGGSETHRHHLSRDAPTIPYQRDIIIATLISLLKLLKKVYLDKQVIIRPILTFLLTSCLVKPDTSSDAMSGKQRAWPKCKSADHRGDCPRYAFATRANQTVRQTTCLVNDGSGGAYCRGRRARRDEAP